MIDYQYYKALYNYSIENPEQFWQKVARENIAWQKDFEQVYSGDITSFNNYAQSTQTAGQWFTCSTAR